MPAGFSSVATQTNKTQMTRALLALREQILSGQFTAGERMSELPLVELLIADKGSEWEEIGKAK